LPSEDKKYYNGFVSLIEEITCFNIEDYYPSNIEKCRNCIYEPACDRTLFVEEE
jgi:hypothetical protein